MWDSVMSLPGTQGSEEEGPGHRLQGAQGGPFAPIDLLPSAPACDPTRPLTPSTWPRSLLPRERNAEALRGPGLHPPILLSPHRAQRPAPLPPASLQPPHRLPPPPAEDQYRSGLTLAWAFHTWLLSCPLCPFLPPLSVHAESPPPPPIKAAPGTHHPPRAWLACVLPETAPAGRCPEAGLSRGDRAP